MLGPLLLALLGSGLGLGAFLPLWCWLQLALLAHLLTDICFYGWPVQLLWPLSRRGWGFGWIEWNDLLPTLTLDVATMLVFCRLDVAVPVAGAGVVLLGFYLGWRAWRPRPASGVGAWVTGGRAGRAAPMWRWLTGDFLS